MGDQPNNVNLATLVVYVVRVERGFASGDEGRGSRVFIVLEGGSGCGPLLLRFWREVVDSRSRCRGREAVSLQRKKKAPQSAASVLISQQYLLCLLPFVVFADLSTECVLFILPKKNSSLQRRRLASPAPFLRRL
jgi:hypothetical protein